VESVAISANKSWDLAELIDLEVLSRDTLSRLDLNDLDVDVVCLRNCANGCRAGVTLEKETSVLGLLVKSDATVLKQKSLIHTG
jgi:hypothetical protein